MTCFGSFFATEKRKKSNVLLLEMFLRLYIVSSILCVRRMFIKSLNLLNENVLSSCVYHRETSWARLLAGFMASPHHPTLCCWVEKQQSKKKFSASLTYLGKFPGKENFDDDGKKIVVIQQRAVKQETHKNRRNWSQLSLQMYSSHYGISTKKNFRWWKRLRDSCLSRSLAFLFFMTNYRLNNSIHTK